MGSYGDNMKKAFEQRKKMLAEWAAKGHGDTPCVGHRWPLPGCPKPEAHADA